MSQIDEHHPRNHVHYCRECGELFPSNVKGEQTPHAKVWRHTLAEHDGPILIRRCSRSCEQRAQPEEIKGGKRLYGKGIEAGEVELIHRYDDLFPKDTD